MFATIAFGIREVIFATNASVEGEATAHYLERVIEPHGVAMSRLARGLPVGSELEYADSETIAQALSSRRSSRRSARSSARYHPSTRSFHCCHRLFNCESRGGLG